MEDRKIADLLISLEDEIDRKCFKIKEKKREEMKKRLFVGACLLSLLVSLFGIKHCGGLLPGN